METKSNSSSSDVSLENGMIFVNDNLEKANIGIVDGIITAISKSSINASKKIDCSGKIVLPGFVDIHVHMREPGVTHKGDYVTESKAAAAGGFTMFVDMPNVEPPTDSLKLFEEKRKIASTKSIVDFNHHIFPVPSEVPKVAKAGAAGFKLFMVKGAYPHDPRLCVEDHGKLYDIFKAIQQTGLPLTVHPADMSLLVNYYEEKKRERPKDEPLYIAFGKAYVEETLVNIPSAALVHLAKKTGVRLHIAHTRTADVIEMIREAKNRGYDITGQMDPRHLTSTKEELARLGPPVLPGGLLSPEQVETMWEGLRSGTIDVLTTDHSPHKRDEIVGGMTKDPWEAPFGSPMFEHIVSVFLTEISKGRISLAQLVKLSATNPAKIVGIYPRKGIIQLGSDADLMVVDLKKEKTLTNERLYTKVGWTPWEGRKVKGAPVMTIRRGEVIMDDGEVIGKPGTGKFVAPLGAPKE